MRKRIQVCGMILLLFLGTTAHAVTGRMEFTFSGRPDGSGRPLALLNRYDPAYAEDPSAGAYQPILSLISTGDGERIFGFTTIPVTLGSGEIWQEDGVITGSLPVSGEIVTGAPHGQQADLGTLEASVGAVPQGEYASYQLKQGAQLVCAMEQPALFMGFGAGKRSCLEIKNNAGLYLSGTLALADVRLGQIHVGGDATASFIFVSSEGFDMLAPLPSNIFLDRNARMHLRLNGGAGNPSVFGYTSGAYNIELARGSTLEMTGEGQGRLFSYLPPAGEGEGGHINVTCDYLQFTFVDGSEVTLDNGGASFALRFVFGADGRVEKILFTGYTGVLPELFQLTDVIAATLRRYG